MIEERYLTERFQLNPQTVRNWIDSGALRAVRVGSRRVRVTESELARFIGDHGDPADAQATGEPAPTATAPGVHDAPAADGAIALSGAQAREVVAAVRDIARAFERLADALARVSDDAGTERSR